MPVTTSPAERGDPFEPHGAPFNPHSPPAPPLAPPPILPVRRALWHPCLEEPSKQLEDWGRQPEPGRMPLLDVLYSPAALEANRIVRLLGYSEPIVTVKKIMPMRAMEH